MEDFKNFFKENKKYSFKHLAKEFPNLTKQQLKKNLDELLEENFLIYENDKYEVLTDDYYKNSIQLGDDDEIFLNNNINFIDNLDNQKLLAILQYKDDKLFLYNSDFEIKAKMDIELTNFVEGDILVVRIKNINDKNIVCNFLEKIGHINDPNIDLKTIAISKSFKIDFTEDSIKQLQNIKSYVSEDEMKNRLDLRSELIYTIDGKDTKDMDDAISVSLNECGNYILGVHIADVSHYVKIKSPLFNEAAKRGTSLYMIDSVIPMLPHELSNGICSLNPGVDRLTLSCIMEIDKKGNIIDYKIVESVINSKKKMTYEDIDKILMDNETVEGYENFIENLKLCNELSFILSKNYSKHGYLHFKNDDIKVHLDKFGRPIAFDEIKPRAGRKIIENFMLAANKTVASNYAYLPFTFRIHEAPKEEEIKDALNYIETLGFEIPSKINLDNNLKLEYILKQLYYQGNFGITSPFILKAMKKAKYSKDNVGHFGLGFSEYTHFTSPIRRFNDLLVHILIKAYNNPNLNDNYLNDINNQLQSICEHISQKEVLADEAEEDAIKLKMIDYIENQTDKYFNGKIINIGPKYLTVKLENNIIGKVDIEDIKGDKYYFNKDIVKIIGLNSKKEYKITDYVRVKLINTSRLLKTVNFRLVENLEHVKTKTLTLS